VLGRTFGIRQLVRLGLNVALVRDLTDTMYNSRRKPFVDHFTGTALVCSHIEKYWCPTITSEQIIGGSRFWFKADTHKM
ncbi:MAG: protein-signal peptide and transmembrane prediction, partial [Limisphaerales bacterium]